MRYLLRNILLALLLAQTAASDWSDPLANLFVDNRQPTNITDDASAANATTTAPGNTTNVTMAPEGGNVTDPTTPPADLNITMAPTGNETDSTDDIIMPPFNDTLLPGNDTLPPLTGNETAAPVPTIAPAPTASVAPRPTPAPVPVGATRQQINARFIVSNLDNIVSPTQVNNSGLSAAWPPFVEDVVSDTTAKNNLQRRRLGQQQQQHRRRLRVTYEENSAYIYDIVLKNNCGDNTHPDLTCHDAYGTYSILLWEDSRENAKELENTYGTATVEAINEGKLYDTMKEITPDTPLFIGTVGEPQDSKMATWAIVLIVLLCVLCCCGILAALYYFFVLDKDGGGGEPKSEPYDEEGFAYDFLIPQNQKVQTEADDKVDDDETKDVDDELFEDEKGEVVEAKMVEDADGDDDDKVDIIPEEDNDSEDENEKEESDNEEINVTAEVEDEDSDGDGDGDETTPLVAGDAADDDDDGLVELPNEIEESDHVSDTEGWDDDADAGEGEAPPVDEEWDTTDGGESGEWEDDAESGEDEDDTESGWDDEDDKPEKKK